MLGDCYYSAYKYQEKNPHVILVHGLVSGQGKLEGIIYNHAWCEYNNMIIDLTLNHKYQKSFSKDVYYLIGDIHTTFTYSYKARIKKSLEVGTYGPWESELLKSEY